MFNYRLTVVDKLVKDYLANVGKRMREPEKALRECGLVLLRSIAKNFEKGGRPVKWVPSLRATSSKGQTLVATARLKNSITMEVAGNRLTVGTNLKYAAIQQLGGIITPKTAKVLLANIPGVGYRAMKKVEIPARPYLVVQDEDENTFKRIIADYTVNG